MTLLEPHQIEETFELIEGKKTLPNHLAMLADWISSRFHVDVLNILTDYVDNDRSRLTIVVRNLEQREKFRDGYNYNSAYQDEIATKYKLFADQINSSRIENLHVCFDEFTGSAYGSLASKVYDDELDSILLLDRSIVDARMVSSLCVLYSSKVLPDGPTKEIEDRIRDAWASILTKHDKHAYFSNEFLRRRLFFFSKQEFDAVYKGSWTNFYRDH